MAKPLFTIFTLAYNMEEYIDETIKSVLNQTEGDFEYIIRDNGSTDNTGAIIESYAKKDERIVVLRNKINGFHNNGEPLGLRGTIPEGEEHICGVHRGDGKYFTTIDADDYFHKDFLRASKAKLEETNAQIAVTGTCFFNEVGTAQRIPPKLLYKKGDTISEEDFILLYGNLRPQWGKIYIYDFYKEHIKEMLDYCGKVKIGQEGDTLVCFLYIQKCSSFVTVEKPYYYYRTKESGGFYKNTNFVQRTYAYGVLFDEGLKLIKHLKCENKETIKFLYSVYFVSVTELMTTKTDKSEESFVAKIECLEEIIKANKYSNSYALNLEMLTACVKALMYYGKKTDDTVLKFANRLPVKLLLFYNGEDFADSEVRSLFLISLLINNSEYKILYNYLSLQVISKFFDSTTGKKEYPSFEDMVATFKVYYSTKCINLPLPQIKNEILDALDEGDINLAQQKLNSILKDNPIDREGVYFKLYISYLRKDKMQMCIYTEIAKAFFGDDDEIIELATQISGESI